MLYRSMQPYIEEKLQTQKLEMGGILTQIPHQFFQRIIKKQCCLTRPDDYAVGMFFMPKNSDENEYCLKIVIKHLEKFGLEVLHMKSAS